MDAAKLAEVMGVTEADIDSLMRMVCESIEADGMRGHLLRASEEERVDIVKAYTKSEVKKFSEFCVSLMTNQEKKSAFDQYLFEQFSD